MGKRIKSFVLTLVLLLGMLPQGIVQAEATTVLTGQAIADYFTGKVDSTYANNQCLGFVAECFHSLGAELSSSCCAYNYGNSHIQSTDINTIPIGADVFFTNTGGSPSNPNHTCGSPYNGHIGVYVGDGYFVHANGTVVERTKLIGEGCDSYYTSRFRGWGFHGNIDVINRPASDLGADFYAFIQHQSTGLYLTNQENSIWGRAYSGDDTQIWHFIRQNDGSYSISSLFNNACFDVLGESQEDGATVYAYAGGYTGGQNQRFFIYSMYGAYYLQPVHCTENKMLDMNLTTNNLEIWGAGEDWAPQEFNIHILPEFANTLPSDIGNNFFAYIKHQSTGKHLENKKGSISGEMPSEDSTQVWKFSKLDNGAYSISNAFDNSCIDVLEISEEDGTTVYAYNGGFTGGLNQQFFIYQAFDAYYFRPAHCTRSAMLDMDLATYELALWGSGENWSPQEFDIIVVKHTIEYNNNGGEDGPNTQEKYFNEEIPISDITPTRLGYDFSGWNTVQNGSGTVFIPGEVYTDNMSIILYAQWKMNCDINHMYSYSLVKEPTLVSIGTLIGTCTKCSGTTTVTLPKLNTTDYSYAVTKAATCTADGTGHYTWKTTTYGTFYFDVTITKTGHSYTSEVTAPTCTAQGYTTHTCGTCGNSYKDTYVAATGHNYSYKATKNPTTSAMGVLTGTCSKCSGTTTVTLPKLNTSDYNYSVTKAATCTADGSGRYTWKTTTYGTFYFNVTIGKTGHSYTSKVTAPTCTAQGYTTHTCGTCGNSYKDTYVAATGHNYSYKATKNPTTSATGVLTGTCSKCSGNTTVTLPKLSTTDYSYAVTKAATCTADGTGRYTWNTPTYGSFCFDVTITKTGHSYTSKVTAPTCTAEGYTTHTCSRCNDSYIDSYVDASDHSYTSSVTNPTCSEQGYTTYTCENCGYSYNTNYTNALEHSYSSTVTAPTCWEEGYTTHICENCGDTYTDAYVAASGHNYTFEVLEEPTVNTIGRLISTICSKCTATAVVTIPNLNTSDYSYSITKAATCTTEGIGRYTMNDTTYGNFYFEVSISKTEHSYSSTVTAPNCTEEGYTIHTCDNCGNSFKDTYVTALGHSYSYEVTQDPTSSETGTLTGICSKCSDVTSVTLPKLSVADYIHTIKKAATCTTDGSEYYIWNTTTYGTFRIDVVVAKTGHNYRSEVTAPTCTEQGFTTYTCDICGDSSKDTYVPTSDHSYSYELTANPTENENGTLTGTCSKCSGTTSVTLPKLNTTDYSYTVTKAVTCTADGTARYTWKTTGYGAFSFDVTIAKTGHSYTSKVTVPTCTAQGYTTHTCSNCGDSYKNTYVEASGHSWDNGVVTVEPTEMTEGEKVYTCTVCKTTKTETLPVIDHTHEYVTEVTPPTCGEQGYTTYTCSACGNSYKDDYVAALNHDYSYTVQTAPTVSADGALAGTCTNCNAVVKITLPALNGTDYTYVVVKDPAASTTGIGRYIWKDTTYGNYQFDVTLPAQSHKHSYSYHVVQNPTEGKDGLILGKCNGCSEDINVTLPKLNTTDYYYWEENTATCTATGEAVYTWKNTEYGVQTFDVTLAKTAHSYASKVTEPTCTQQGYTTYTCERCGDSYQSDMKNALGHNWGQWEQIKVPTGASEGEEKRSCLNCDTTETRPVSKLTHPFVDVPAGKFYEVPVIWAVNNEITNGIDETHFAPDNICNRGQVVTFLWRAAGSPEPTSSYNPFTDVKEGKFYYKAVLWAVEEGITKGTSATTFSPNDNCTRGHVATFLWRTLDEPNASSTANPFTDVAQGKFYYDAVLWAAETGVTTGMTATTFAPNNACTRGQIVTFLYRALS